MTPAQLATLKAAILADPVLAAYPMGDDGCYDMAARELNVVANPAFVVWDDRLTPEKFEAAVIIGATQLDGLTSGKRDELFFIGKGVRNCNDTNVRAAIDDACGSANTLKNALIAAEKRNALLIEKIFATGTGTTVSPATLVWAGTVNYQDVKLARAL